MAVEDKYINTDIVNNKSTASFKNTGSKPVIFIAKFEVEAADDDGSIYRIVKDIPYDLVPHSLIVTNDAITGGTDFDIGIYETLADGGIVLDKDIFADGLDLSSAHIEGAGISGLAAIPIEDSQKTIYEFAGETLSTKKRYDIAITANTVGTAAGTIVVKGIMIPQ